MTNDIITDQRVNRIASTLVEMGNEVLVIGRKRKSDIKIFNSVFSIKLFKLLFNKGPLFYAEYNFRLFFYLLFKKFDVITSNDLDTLPAGFLASKLKKKKLIFDSHELFPEVPELVGRNFVKKIWELMEKLFYPGIKYSYTVCDSIASFYKKKYGMNMQVIRNLPVQKKTPDVKVNLKQSNEKIILYQGAVNVGRGLELVIRSMNYIDNARFFIIGEGDILEKLRKMVNDTGLVNKVFFTGRIPVIELHSYTVQADIGISLEENLGLNYYYALPNKLFDYIQAKVPVLVSDFPEMGALVKKYDIGQTTASVNPEELADIIKKMLSETEDIKRWKINLDKAADELCWEKEKEKLTDFYRLVLTNGY